MYVKDAKAVEVAMYKVLRNIASAASDVIAECENAGALAHQGSQGGAEFHQYQRLHQLPFLGDAL